MENRKSPGIAFWCCVAIAALTAYLAAYGVVRWQNVLIYDMKISTAPDGTGYSEIGVCGNEEFDDSTELQRRLAPLAEVVFVPLCRVEDAYRRAIWKE